jgi:hypothetical protein
MHNRILFFLLSFLFLQINAIAQCSLCTKTAAGLNDNAAKGLNAGIIFLAAMPLSIILFLGFRWYKSYKHTI